MDRRVLRTLGQAIGVPLDPTGGCRCVVCGDSSFVDAGPAKRVLGPNFTDHDLIDGRGVRVCAGCMAILSGRPGDDPPPLRLSSFVVAGGVLRRVGIDEMTAVLGGEWSEVEVVGWAISRQKHVSLRCGRCSPERYLVGCDHGTIDWRIARDVPLLDAVWLLRQAATQAQILHGSYPPHVVQRMPEGWREAETLAAGYRPSLHLEMAVAVVRRPDPIDMEADMPIPSEYRLAAEILSPLCYRSAYRDQDPIRFWQEWLPRRLSAASTSVDLVGWISYLTEALRVATYHPDVVALVERLDQMTPEEQAAILAVCRRDHRLLIAVVRQIREEQY